MRVIVSHLLATCVSVALMLAADWLYFGFSWLHAAGIPLFICMNTVTSLVVLRQTGASRIAQALIVCITLKLLIAMSVVVTASFFLDTHFRDFSIHFVVQYVVFTIFETLLLTAHLRSKSIT
jgi:hypothetical protein